MTPIHPVAITGFGPFPGMPINPTEALVNALAERHGPSLRARILPTQWRVLPEVAAFASTVPVLILFGVAGTARRIRYERLSQPTAARVDADGKLPGAAPHRRRTTRLNVPLLAQAARRQGFVVDVSGNAGSYLCNASYGAALSTNPHALFVHVPPLQRRGPLSLDGLMAHAEWLMDVLAQAEGSPRHGRSPKAPHTAPMRLAA
ncbi:MAG: hypothetical protein AAGD34_01750 [Pseudomonadota bacterium]